MNTNTQRSNEPLYKVLNELRTKSEWESETSTKSIKLFAGDGHGGADLIAKFKNNNDQQESNAQYAALAVNNLNQLAEFAEWVVKEIETTPDELTDALLGLIKLKAKEALNKIS